MNHAGEIDPLARLVRPHVAIITTVEPVHLAFFPSVEAIADAKAEIFRGIEPGGAAVINRDNPHYARLRQHAHEAGVDRVVSFSEHAGADARLIACSLHPDCSTVRARILGVDLAYKIGAPGRHLVLNSLAVLAAVSLLRADLALAALGLTELKPASGRGARILRRENRDRGADRGGRPDQGRMAADGRDRRAHASSAAILPDRQRGPDQPAEQPHPHDAPSRPGVEPTGRTIPDAHLVLR